MVATRAAPSLYSNRRLIGICLTVCADAKTLGISQSFSLIFDLISVNIYKELKLEWFLFVGNDFQCI